MKVPDLTELMLGYSYWFMGGLLLFYLLNVVKVYILARIQANVLNSYVSAQKPFSGFLRNFTYSLFTEKKLHLLTVSFLIKYEKRNWPEMQNIPINKILKVLTAITTFLKPFLVVALVFWGIRIWIGSHFLYEPLQITLGEIQKKLSFIHSLPWVKLVILYKALWYLIISAGVLWLLAIAQSEKFLRKLKKSYSYGFTCLSIFLNVSFFYIGVAGVVSHEHLKLTSLEISIVETHNKIYTYAAETIAAPIIDHFFEDAQDFYDAEAKQLEIDAILTKSESYDSVVVIPYWQEIAQRIADYKLEYVFNVSKFDLFPPGDKFYLTDPVLPTPSESSADASYKTDVNCGLEIDPGLETIDFPEGTKPPATIIDDYYDRRIAETEPAAEYDSYISVKDNWNIASGKDILADIKLVRDKAVSSYKLQASKMEQMLELLFSFALELGFDKLVEKFSQKPQKSLKKIASSLMEVNFKDCFVKATVKLINGVCGVFKKGVSGISCNQEILSAQDKVNIQLKGKMWLTERKIALGKSHQQLMAERSRIKVETEAENRRIAKDQAAEKRRQVEEEKLAQARVKDLHMKYAQLERDIIREIRSKSFGIPTDYGRRMSDYLKGRMNSLEWSNAIDKMKTSGTYDENLSMEENIEAAVSGVKANEKKMIKQELQAYFVPPEPTVGIEEYGALLENNYALVSGNGSVASIAKAVIKRDNLSEVKFKSLFTKICHCCGLPLSFPVCGCNMLVP